MFGFVFALQEKLEHIYIIRFIYSLEVRREEVALRILGAALLPVQIQEIRFSIETVGRLGFASASDDLSLKHQEFTTDVVYYI